MIKIASSEFATFHRVRALIHHLRAVQRFSSGLSRAWTQTKQIRKGRGGWENPSESSNQSQTCWPSEVENGSFLLNMYFPLTIAKHNPNAYPFRQRKHPYIGVKKTECVVLLLLSCMFSFFFLYLPLVTILVVGTVPEKRFMSPTRKRINKRKKRFSTGANKKNNS